MCVCVCDTKRDSSVDLSKCSMCMCVFVLKKMYKY